MADNTNRLAGTCYLTVDGQSYAIAGEGTYRTAAPKRESQIGQDGYHGYSEMPTAGKMSWKGRDSGGVSVQDLATLSNVTVVFELANGKLITGRNMTRVGDPPEVNTEDATFEIEFEGPSVTEA